MSQIQRLNKAMHSIHLHLHINTFLLLRNSLLEKAFCLVTQNHSNMQIFQSSLHTYYKLQSFRSWTSVGSFPCTAYTIKDVFNNLYMKRGISKTGSTPSIRYPLNQTPPKEKSTSQVTPKHAPYHAPRHAPCHAPTPCTAQLARHYISNPTPLNW